MFTDIAKLHISSGKGGDGSISFRREKFVAAGGPDGGDGGKGGDVIFEIDNGVNTLSAYRYTHKFAAQDGEKGAQKHRHGKKGEDLILKVPEGTIIKEATTGKVITDMSGENRREVILKGGKGGKGNSFYVTPTMQCPHYAQPGQSCKELDIILELKCIADVGLVGFPNVGKSSLLNRVSNARPQIADYHFTTLNPFLGVVDLKGQKGFVMADIPGLIEGAAEGVGLGHEFLRHIERTKVLVHMVDGSGVEGRNPVEDIIAINKELSKYSTLLENKKQIIVLNKMDLLFEDEKQVVIDEVKSKFKDNEGVMTISCATGEGINELLLKIRELLDKDVETPTVFEREFFVNEMVDEEEPYTVYYDEENEEYVVEGPRIERMLGYTNLDTEKGFLFFQKFLDENGILDELRKLGVNEGDTVRLYGWSFEFYEN